MPTSNQILPCILMSVLLLASCADEIVEGPGVVATTDQALTARSSCSEPELDRDDGDHPRHARFAVLSDAHLYDTSLGVTGDALEAYLEADRKMLGESDEILRTVIQHVIAARPEFVLIPGDMTKDGELVNHERFIQYLMQLERVGIKAFVVPGNHDIMNSHAFAYGVDGVTPVPTVTESEFVRLYHQFGYGQAVTRDPSSLSYVAEVTPGLWLLALDSSRHRENTLDSEPITAGRISTGTRDWALEAARRATRSGKRMIAMLHHGLLEHFEGQTRVFPEYVVEDAAALAKELAAAGIQLAFTGHFHAQDIVRTEFEDGSEITDIETGSLVTFPSPYRIVDFNLRHGVAVVTTHNTTRLPSNPDFARYAAKLLEENIATRVRQTLTSSGEIDLSQAQALAPVFVQAFAAHCSGDESPADQVASDAAALLANSGTATGQVYGSLLLSIHEDASPSDNNVVLRLSQSQRRTPACSR